MIRETLVPLGLWLVLLGMAGALDVVELGLQTRFALGSSMPISAFTLVAAAGLFSLGLAMLMPPAPRRRAMEDL